VAIHRWGWQFTLHPRRHHHRGQPRRQQDSAQPCTTNRGLISGVRRIRAPLANPACVRRTRRRSRPAVLDHLPQLVAEFADESGVAPLPPPLAG
jgi:hypothetical protein